jgi:hypothetical protein
LERLASLNIIVALQGIYRYDKFLNNYELNFYNSLKKLKDPVKEIKADEQYVVFRNTM